MPYRRYGRRTTRKFIRRKSRRTLAPKSIKRRRSAGAQSKQILSLSRKVNMLTKSNTSLIRTSWARGQERIQTLTESGTPFICPIPYHMMDPTDSFDNGGSGATTTWRSNLFQVPAFRKKLVFGTSDAALSSNKIRHTGSVIKWQMESTEPAYSKVTLLLVRAKRGMADQLAADRMLLGTTIPFGPDGQSEHFKKDVDYVVHDIPTSITGGSSTYHSVTWNKKYWDVLYQKQVAFGHPGAQGFIPQVMAANASPQNNAMVATGQIRMPPCGMIRSTAKDPSGVTKASELGLVDQRNENACYLVAIQNGVAADLESITLGWICVDYYKASV